MNFEYRTPKFKFIIRNSIFEITLIKFPRHLAGLGGKMAKVIPTLRIYDYDKTIAFYINWLGFNIDFQHTFEPGMPRFLQVSLGDVILHLSEHHGDGSPGVHITINDFTGLRAYHEKLIAAKYKYNRPGLEVPFWDEGSTTLTVIDPVGNRIRFIEKVK